MTSYYPYKSTRIQEDDGLLIKASGALTADTNGTAIDVGPLGVCKVVVMCSAGFATGTLQIAIQQSTDNDSSDKFSTTANQIAVSPVITGSSTRAGSVIWEQELRNTSRYIRYTSTNETATGAVSKTFEILLTTGDN